MPSGSVHSSPRVRARAVRNVHSFALYNVKEELYPKVRLLTSHIPFVPEVYYQDDYRFPLVGIQLPATRLLDIDVAAFCACGDPNVSPTDSGEDVQLTASEIILTTFDSGPECQKCLQTLDSRFVFDHLISVNVERLQINCNYPLCILSHFRRLSGLRNPKLVINIAAGHPCPDRAAVIPKYAQRFDIPEHQITIEDEQDSDW